MKNIVNELSRLRAVAESSGTIIDIDTIQQQYVAGEAELTELRQLMIRKDRIIFHFSEIIKNMVMDENEAQG